MLFDGILIYAKITGITDLPENERVLKIMQRLAHTVGDEDAE